MKISTRFDAGALTVTDLSNPTDIRLALRPDNASDFAQWFYFRLQGAAYQNCVMHFENAAQAAYPDGWEDYQACASYDRQNWFRVPTRYENGVLTIEHTPLANSIYYAYFEPYSSEQHLNLLGDAQGSGLCQIDDLGSTVEGRDMNLLTIGNQVQSDLKVWVIARQHPGETMAEWFVEGLLERLLDGADPVARRLREQAVFHIVPNMNPDGACRGNLRTNAAGRNLNREWMQPSLEASPEVFLTRAAMEARGVDFYLDVHGDESLPHVFFSTAEEVPGFSDLQRERQARFVEAFLAASPDFQTRVGYLPGRFEDELLTLASKWVAYRFGCVSITLEMPFKDSADLPNPATGWDGARSKRLGAAILQALLRHVEGR